MSSWQRPTFLKADQWLEETSAILPYSRDWTRFYKPNARAVCFPETTEEVQEVLRWALREKIPLVPSGGLTGLSGGAVAASEEVVLNLSRMNKILEWNEADRLIHCQAGVVTENLQSEAAQYGYYFPVDFASRGSSQIGGNIATNAGGLKVIRYGMMRNWVAGLEVVLGSGEVLDLRRPLVKDNTGYDLKQLFIGSEGTLGIITEALVRICLPPQNLKVLLLAAPALSAALEILKVFQKNLNLTAFEFFTEEALTKVLHQYPDLQRPFEVRSPYYFIIEFEELSSSSVDAALSSFDEALEKGILLDGKIAQSSQQAAEFWKYRESISETLSSFQPYKSDISVRISRIPQFVEETEKTLKQKFGEMELIWFGHIGDGNLHLNLLKPDSKSLEAFKADADQMSKTLFEIVKKFDGSISAEHGIGLVKKPYLHYSRTAAEIDIFRAMKKIFDPSSILNPGKIFDL